LAPQVTRQLTESPARRSFRRRLADALGPSLVVIALASLGAGLLLGANTDSRSQRNAKHFVEAWERADYSRMHSLISSEAAERWPAARFKRAYQRANAIATATRIEAGEAKQDGDVVRVPVEVSTRVFGAVRATIALPMDGDGRVKWDRHLTFPGVPAGAKLRRRTRAPDRASIVALGGETIVEGPAAARMSPLGPAGTSIAGSMGQPEDEATRGDLYARGFPRETAIGLTGLERILEREVAGQPGGTLLAGSRVLARTTPRQAGPVRTTIDVPVQRAAVAALAGRLGGVAALDPHTGEVRALAGIAFSAPQPPGSTFKIITTTAALEKKLVKTITRFPVETKAVIDGVDLENANGESCGGTFKDSFAHSCNSVFAPLGVKIGAKSLVETAERYGFNAQPSLPGAQPSTIPPAAEIDSPLAVASTAIGQGRLLATPLQLASMAQVVAADGIRYDPTLVPPHGRPQGRRVTSRRVARALEKLMVAVVAYGTGTSASLSPTRVAGKTGTAELENTTKKEVQPGEPPPPSEESEPETADTDAWFTAYAPIRRPELAVAVMLVRAGAGGDTAAPAAKAILQAALKKR
jgi:penicillin-binding protein A